MTSRIGATDPQLQLGDAFEFAARLPDGPIVLRPYQIAANDVLTAPPAHIWRQLVVLATGAGKTVVAADLVKRQIKPGMRALFLAHRDVLIRQAAEKIAWYDPTVAIEVEKGVERARRGRDAGRGVVVGSVQSFHHDRLRSFARDSFDLIICDEAHHSANESYRQIFEHFGCFDDVRRTPLVGITATPKRSDKKTLADTYQREAYRKDIAELIREGYLCEVYAKRINSETNLSDIEIVRGDYDAKQLAKAVDSAERNATVVQAFLKYAAERKTLVFAASIAHAQRLAELFVQNGVRAEAVWGVMDDAARAAALTRFARGETQLLCNHSVLCLDEETELLTREGWKGIDSIEESDHIANFRLDGTIYFDRPNAIIKREREPDEQMVELSTERQNFRVSAGHNMLHRYHRGSNWQRRQAHELVGKSGLLPVAGQAVPEPILAAQETQLSVDAKKRLVSAAAYNLRKNKAFEWDASFAEADRRLESRRSLRRKDPSELTLDECRFVGFWLGDGTVARLGSGGLEYRLCQSLRYADTVQWLDNLVSRLNLDVVRREKETVYSESLQHANLQAYNHVIWSFSRGTGFATQRRRGVFALEPYLEKDGSDLYWGLDSQQFEALIHGLWLADGAHGNRLAPHGAYRRITTIRKALVDRLQAIGSCRGFRSSYMERPQKNPQHQLQYEMTFTKTTIHTMPCKAAAATGQPEISTGWQSERVWCVTSTSGNIVTRRRGRVTIMGNCEGFDEPAVSCVILARPTRSATALMQIIGRGTRLHPSKTDCLVLDIQDTNDVRPALTAAAAFGLPPAFDENDAPLGACADLIASIEPGLRDKVIDLESLRKIHARVLAGLGAVDIDILDRREAEAAVAAVSVLRWRKSGDTYTLHVGPERYQLELDLVGNWSLNWFRGAMHRKAPEVFASEEQAFAHWDAFVEARHADERKLIRNDEAWLKEPASDKQLFTLHGYGVFAKDGSDVPPELSRAEASDLLSNCMQQGLKFSYRRVPESLRHVRPPIAWRGPHARKSA